MLSRPTRRRTAATVLMLAGASTAQAHHSFVTKYDPAKSIRLAGTVGDVHLQNPHSMFELNAAGKSWTVETEGVTAAKSKGLDASNLTTGATVTVTGSPARDGSAALGLQTIVIGGKTLTLRRSAR